MSSRIASPIMIAAVLTLSPHIRKNLHLLLRLKKLRRTTEIVTGGAPILSSIPSAMTTIANY
jgi:hypothetical protein